MNKNFSVAILQLEGVTKKFGRQAEPAVKDVSLTVAHGEIWALLGPSGCGKTTLLRLIAGFEQAQSGTIYINGVNVTNKPPEQRGVGMVFQDFALFPHLTAAQNVGFGLQNCPPATKTQIIKDTLALVGLQDFGSRYPHELSGGQQQRLALARALAPNPALILLDEPLSNLDVQIRWQLRMELRRILKTAGKSAILVTHDQEEALHIADQVAVMRAGKIEQMGTPQTIYYQPQTRFVAEFVSQANFLPAFYQDGKWCTEIGDFALPLAPNCQKETELVIRPESVQVIADKDGVATISDRIFLGREVMYYLVTAKENQLVARMPAHSDPLPIGTRVALHIPAETVLCLDQWNRAESNCRPPQC
ncbi:MAG: ABC transporter ATP-binding protein [Pseudanabaenaceae cyanobacterium]